MIARLAAGVLERGRLGSPASRALGRVWAGIADPVRRVSLPRGATVVGVAGSTLGGSGATPTVLALARALRERGAPVAVLAHGYRGTVRGLRVVTCEDPVGVVGDEALMLARELAGTRVPVVVAARRDAGLELAAELGRIVVVDSLLQTRPRRLDRSLLVLDGDAPWGAGSCPPAGDLRARRDLLLAAADRVLTSGPNSLGSVCVPVERSTSILSGARTSRGTLIGLEELRHMRLGLTLAVARPSRIVAALASQGVRPSALVLARDHAKPAKTRANVDAWLTSAKCATKLSERFAGRPVLVLEHRVRLPSSVVDWVFSALRAPVLLSAPWSTA